jgi:SAM-dependent methyltransferase
MHVHRDELSDISRYIHNHSGESYEEQKPVIENIFETIQRWKPLDRDTRILEIGIGRGWLQVYGKKAGYAISGVEITQQLIDVAKENGSKLDVELELILGNIEEIDLSPETYDVIFASSVFETRSRLAAGLNRIVAALKPGGLFYFDSTNKFSFTSGEYDFPLYGWMPNSLAFCLRRWRQGEDVMRCGIDFHQFTYPQLRRAFKLAGFSRIMDLVDFKEVANVKSEGKWKRTLLGSVKRARPLKHVLLTFVPATIFICIK